MSLLRLADLPTPIEHDATLGLWMKRDDRAAALYGGNKVRKLERLLGDARAAGKRRILTLGAAGSHQIVASALFAEREGFEVEAVLVPQPSSTHARQNLRVAVAHGLVPVPAGSWPAAAPLLATRARMDSYVIPLGGSNVLGTLAFVDAAKELAAQVASGAMPEPDVIVVAMGSGGTAAGLAVGLELTGMRTRVVGVVISPPTRVVGAMARRLAKKTAEAAGLSRAQTARAVLRLEADRRWLGRGYGSTTPEGIAATNAAARAGLELDPTYTAKALACALERRSSDEVILFWHTLSSAPLDALLASAPELPPHLEALFRY